MAGGRRGFDGGRSAAFLSWPKQMVETPNWDEEFPPEQ